MSHRVTLLLACWIALWSTTAAATGGTGPYVELNAGVSIPSDADIAVSRFDFGRASFGTGWNVGGALGYGLNDLLRGEFDLSYRMADVETIEVAGSGVQPGAGHVGVLAGMANGYVDIKFNDYLTPYVGVGIGFAHVDVSALRESTFVFAWNVLGGLWYRLSDRVVLDAGYRYLSTAGGSCTGFASCSDPNVVAGTLDIHEIVFAARFEY